MKVGNTVGQPGNCLKEQGETRRFVDLALDQMAADEKNVIGALQVR